MAARDDEAGKTPQGATTEGEPMSKRPFPPGYEKQIERMVTLIPQWVALQDTPPDLQWHRPGDTAFIGPLRGGALKYLAASPDAIRLLEWLDDKTEHQCTLLQASAALGLLRDEPGATRGTT